MIKHFKQGAIAAGLLLFFVSISHATDVNLQSVQPNQQITTQDAQLKINMNAQQSLPPGTYTFELVVVDDSGNQSTPARAQVVVRDTAAPTAVLIAPQSVNVGQAIILSGSKSTDIGGKVGKYIWRLVR